MVSNDPITKYRDRALEILESWRLGAAYLATERWPWPSAQLEAEGYQHRMVVGQNHQCTVQRSPVCSRASSDVLSNFLLQSPERWYLHSQSISATRTLHNHLCHFVPRSILHPGYQCAVWEQL